MTTKPTTTETFAEYAARLGVDEHHPMRDNALRVWEMEREAERTYPTVIPPCPSWCELPTGHEYDSYLPDGQGGVEHLRMHRRQFGAVFVDAAEEYTAAEGVKADGAVDIYVPEVNDVDATTARTIAADLLAAADLLDRLAGQVVPDDRGQVPALDGYQPLNP